jgi:hypothetical protein
MRPLYDDLGRCFNGRIGLELDTSRTFVSLAKRRELIRAVRDAPARESEPDWLEWKSSVDLTEKRWHAEIARHSIGLANRAPDRAARTAGGFGYVLLGVEPGNLCGVTQIDNASLEAGVGKYVGRDGPQWQPEYVDVDGVNVLVITVASPQAGDRIYAFEKEFHHLGGDMQPKCHYKDGDVFVRREGRTERATAAEIRMLERRLLGDTQQPQLLVDLAIPDGHAAVTPIDLSSRSVDEWIDAERRSLARPRDKPIDATAHPTGTASAEVQRMKTLLGTVDLVKASGLSVGFPESRSPEEYDEAVEVYLSSAREHIAALARSHAVDAGLGVVRFALENQTEDNYVEVAVQLYIAGSVRAYLSWQEADAQLEGTGLVDRPRPWGPRGKWDPLLSLSTHSHSAVGLAPGRRTVIDNSGSARIHFASVNLRPAQSVSLEAVYIIAEASEATELVGEWEATSTSVSGVARGTVVVPLGAAIGLTELFERTSEEED